MKRLSILLLGLTAAVAGAQQPDSAAAPAAKPPAPTAAESTYARARQLVLDGNGPAGRALIDSLVARTDPLTRDYADALFWRASLAATAADAERDYRRIIVEHSLSPRAAEALLAIAQLEMSRGDRRGATEHLQRYLLENPASPDRGRAGLWLARLLIEQGQLPPGCTALAHARLAIPDGAVELRNQAEYYGQRCIGVDTVQRQSPRMASGADSSEKSRGTGVARDTVGKSRATVTGRDTASKSGANASVRDSSARPSVNTGTRDSSARSSTDAGKRDSSARPSTAPSRRDSTSPAATSATSATRYSVQVAAYETRADAEALAKRLRERGLASRVYGIANPFRVRIGRYASRADAQKLLEQLRAQGMNGFITTAEEGTSR
jgi:cell division septation protein DedD